MSLFRLANEEAMMTGWKRKRKRCGKLMARLPYQSQQTRRTRNTASYPCPGSGSRSCSVYAFLDLVFKRLRVIEKSADLVSH